MMIGGSVAGCTVVGLLARHFLSVFLPCLTTLQTLLLLLGPAAACTPPTETSAEQSTTARTPRRSLAIVAIPPIRVDGDSRTEYARAVLPHPCRRLTSG